MVLNFICSIGLKQLSWILVLFPYLMLFLSVGIVQNIYVKEKFGVRTDDSLPFSVLSGQLGESQSSRSVVIGFGANDRPSTESAKPVNNPGNQNSALAKKCNAQEYGRVKYCNWNQGKCISNGAQRGPGVPANICSSVK
jgi:hypothetical protein